MNISHRIHVWYIYANIYHQYTHNVSIYTIHGSYGYGNIWCQTPSHQPPKEKRPLPGGKKDDTSCVVAEVVEWTKEARLSPILNPDLVNFCRGFAEAPVGSMLEKYWLVVWNMNVIFPYIGSSQLTFIFFGGVETTNQNGHGFV